MTNNGWKKTPRIGVLDIQGSVEEHCESLEKLGVKSVLVKKPEQIADLDGLIIPGGESTTVSKLLFGQGIAKAIKLRKKDLPVWGTCAGAILMAKKIAQTSGRGKPKSLKLMDISLQRNAYGRQIDSFETDINIPSINHEVQHEESSKSKRGRKGIRSNGVRIRTRAHSAIFIRAPRVKKIGKNVQTLAELDGKPVMVQQGKFLATMFHPELTSDLRVHKYFVEKMCNGKN